MALIAPSLLASDFLNLGRDCEMLNKSEADWFHLDVMDGIFVPNISFGMPIIAAINRIATKTLDVHLMVEKPERFIKDFIADIDLVCIMSVNPGFGGQKFIENTYAKVRELKQMILAAGASTLIEIDGGVNSLNAKTLISAGADVLVAGSFVFNSADPLATIADLKKVVGE
jgi:ribulose-phosphate 3-epimerase